MAFHLLDRYGNACDDLSLDGMRALLASLDVKDDEHPDVSLTHESGWTLSVFPSGLVIWENLDRRRPHEPHHMRGVPRTKALDLWIKLSQGDIAAVEAEAWLPGYG